jgi:phosphoribosylanthranilate isomerase
MKAQKDILKSVPVPIPKYIQKVGVFVNSDLDKLIEITEFNKLDYIQLHGDEDPAYCLLLKEKGIKIIKVFRIDDQFDFMQTVAFDDIADYFLFDTKAKQYGGTGKKFNWAKLNEYKGTIPFLLSGGIGPDDYGGIQEIKNERLLGVDINSGFEIEPGLKDISMIKRFIEKII